MMNLLSENISNNFIDFVVKTMGYAKNPDWIGSIIGKLFAAVGIVAVGVIVFTLILKTIVLPLDLYSRINSKKQALIMKKMRPQMEKLKKQYENDQKMYSQKVNELQKKSGYSMLGACLPTLVSLIVFMVVFSSFSFYSQYANLQSYNGMVNAYNTSVNEYILTDLNGNTVNENGFLIAGTDPATRETAYRVDFDAYEKTTGNSLAEYELEKDKLIAVKNFVREIARTAAANYYENEIKPSESFLWIGNVWYPDSAMNKRLPQEYTKFASAVSRAAESNDPSYEPSYNEVTHNLTEQKTHTNGYFILIIIAILMMFLQQFIMMRSQKDANELSSVNGQAAKTTKWMTIAMPIIYGIFSLFYSAAFSIYMIINTTYGLITTVIVNAILNAKFKKMEANGTLDEYLNRKARKRELRANQKRRLR